MRFLCFMQDVRLILNSFQLINNVIKIFYTFVCFKFLIVMHFFTTLRANLNIFFNFGHVKKNFAGFIIIMIENDTVSKTKKKVNKTTMIFLLQMCFTIEHLTFKMNQGYTFNTIIAQYTVSSKEKCAMHCLQASLYECAFFKFNSTSNSCELSSNAFVDADSHSDSSAVVYEGK